MIGHLGPRISALLDGQLPLEEAERAWAHVHECHFCRDQVEREGWVKTRLAGLSHGAGAAPDHLKGSLMGGPMTGPAPVAHAFVTAPRRSAGLVAIGGGALGAAVVGVLVLGAAPGSSPSNERRTPVTHLVGPSSGPRTVLPTSYDVGLPRFVRPTP